MGMEATGSLIIFNIEGKPLEKLIDVVSKGIGTLYQPRQRPIWITSKICLYLLRKRILPLKCNVPKLFL